MKEILEGGCLVGESGAEFHDTRLELKDGVFRSVAHGSLGFSASCPFSGEVLGGGCIMGGGRRRGRGGYFWIGEVRF